MRPRSNIYAPKWIWLYALVPIGLLLFWLADLIPSTNSWRIIAECGAVFAACGLAMLWVRANRFALTQIDSSPNPDGEWEPAVEYQEKLLRFHRPRRRFPFRIVAGRDARLRVGR